MALPVKLGNVLLCEDVRAELNGKHSILGTYSGDILVSDATGVIRVGLYAELMAIEAKTIQVELKVYFDSRLAAGLKGELFYKDVKDPAVVYMSSFPMNYVVGGNITIDLICGGITERILTRSIRQAPTNLNAMFSRPPPPQPVHVAPSTKSRRRKEK